MPGGVLDVDSDEEDYGAEEPGSGAPDPPPAPSALAASLSAGKYGGGYYHAHAPRGAEGDTPAPLPPEGGVRIDPAAATAAAAAAPRSGRFAAKAAGYYYAHAPRSTGADVPAPLPAEGGVLLETREASVSAAAAEKVSTYAFEDGAECVKVYVPLHGIRERCDSGEATVRCGFTEDSFALEVEGYTPGKVLRLATKRLLGDIVPGESKWRVTGNKVVVSLRKATEGPLARKTWHALT